MTIKEFQLTKLRSVLHYREMEAKNLFPQELLEVVHSIAVNTNFTLLCKKICHHGSIAYSFKSNIFWYHVWSYCNLNVCNDHDKDKMQKHSTILLWSYTNASWCNKRFQTYRYRLRLIFPRQFKKDTPKGLEPVLIKYLTIKQSSHRECLNRYIVHSL